MKKLYFTILLICMASTGYAQSCENNVVSLVEITNASGVIVTVSMTSSSTVYTLPFGDTQLSLHNVPISNNTIYVKAQSPQGEVCAIYIPNYAQNSNSLQSLTFSIETTGFTSYGATVGCTTPISVQCSSQ
ncbi:MAG: hypothetical protein HWD59_14630 [Coxiellaceae bacterium]|nr:MAG: hypothetical protein HWD59_14630 [Coxiellaceae bacterium]